MKPFTNCPKCHKPLLNTPFKLKCGSEFWRKDCTNYIDHWFTSVTSADDDDTLTGIGIVIDMKTQLRATWNLIDKHIIIHNNMNYRQSLENGVKIPYFEPDLSNYKKIINKLKTYAVFL
jgi:hypothetical protein